MSVNFHSTVEFLLPLQVTVPRKYKEKMCGLCGNYNGISTDDFTGKHKTNYTNALDFAASWQRNKTSCSFTHYNRVPVRQRCSFTDKDTLSWISEHCNLLRSYLAGSDCNTINDIDSYYYQCIDKLCSSDNPFSQYCFSARSIIKACHSPDSALSTAAQNILAHC